MIHVKPLTTSDIVKIYGHTFSHSIRGVTVTIDDEIIGVAGVVYSQPLQCFSNMNDELKDSPRSIVEGIRKMRKILQSFDTPVFAFPNDDEPTAVSFLTHIGFKPITDKVFVWIS